MKRSTITATQPPRGTIKINRPFSTMPVIVREYTEDGVRYKEAADGRIFNADRYNEIYQAKQIKPVNKHKKGFKGDDKKSLPAISRANNLKRFANG